MNVGETPCELEDTNLIKTLYKWHIHDVSLISAHQIVRFLDWIILN